MEDIKRLLVIFRDELDTASQAFYAWKAINNLASSNKDIYYLLDKNALSWNIITYSLQSTFFITLGRLFDLDGKAFSIHALLRACIDNIDQFSKEAIRNRKLKYFDGNEPFWLNKYMEDSYVPVLKDFQILRGETSKKQKEYEDVYRPIRHQVIAHTDKQTIENVDELFGKTDVGQIEGILHFLYEIEMIVYQLLEDGQLYKIGDFSSDEGHYVKKDIEDLIKKLRNEKIPPDEEMYVQEGIEDLLKKLQTKKMSPL